MERLTLGCNKPTWYWERQPGTRGVLNERLLRKSISEICEDESTRADAEQRKQKTFKKNKRLATDQKAGGSNPSRRARKETPFVCQTKGVSFQRNKSLAGFVKCPPGVKYGFTMWNACGREWIYFISHSVAHRIFHNDRRSLFHIRRIFHFTFCHCWYIIIAVRGGFMRLYRPVGQAELDLIASTNYKEYPPRLPEQPIFYPVLNEKYAREIA